MERPSQPEFEELLAAASDHIAPLLALSLDDVGLADAALARALTELRRRWGRRRGSPTVQAAMIELYRRSFVAATATGRSRSRLGPPGRPAIEHQTPGLDPEIAALRLALAELPVRQRAALLTSLRMGWTISDNAAAHQTEDSTIELRITRALDQLERELGVGRAEVIDAVALAESGHSPSSGRPDLDEIERQARRLTLRNRVGGSIAALAIIATSAAAVRAITSSDPVAPEEVETVDPPRSSQAPHAPISDGHGGFVALGHGPGLISESADGVDWYAGSHLNPRRINLRLFVERFFRSDGRFVALIDSETGTSVSVNGSDAPRVGVSADLGDWELIDFDPGPLPDVDGLKTSIDLVSAAAVGDRVLLAATVDYEVDFPKLRLDRNLVATMVESDSEIRLYQHDGSVTSVPVASETPTSGPTGGDLPAPGTTRHRYFLSDGGADFIELDPTAAVELDPWTLFSFDGRFAMLDRTTTSLYVSGDGEIWDRYHDLGIDNHLGLAAGSSAAGIAISPADGVWTSTRMRSGRTAIGSIPVGLDPTTIWIRPQLVHGPAGWAMFVTTSRPWEQGDEGQFGWAVNEAGWIVERKAGEGMVVARSPVDGTIYTYLGLDDFRGRPRPHPHVVRGLFGGVRLLDPESGELVVEVSAERIRDSWITGEDLTPAPIGEVSVGDWTISGNLRRGPITATRPSGSTTTWSDGFDFTNGDPGDGAETDLFAGGTDPVIELFDAEGRVELRVALSALDGLDLAPRDPNPDRVRAVVAFSPDGVNWSRVWESTRDTWYGSVAVGDDEVLVSASGIAAGPIRVPVGESAETDG